MLCLISVQKYNMILKYIKGGINKWKFILLFQERGPLPGPKTGLSSNTRKWIVQGDTCWQSKRFYWERAPGWRAVGKGTQENCSATWLEVLGFMVMGLVSGWSLGNHSNSESFLVAHASLSQDGCYREGFWEVDGQVVFPLDLSRTLPTFPELFRLVVAY